MEALADWTIERLGVDVVSKIVTGATKIAAKCGIAAIPGPWLVGIHVASTIVVNTGEDWIEDNVDELISAIESKVG